MSMLKVKVCGITRSSDAELVARLGADMIGLIFYPDSPRCVSVKQAKQIISVLPDSVSKVGVMVEPDIDWLLKIAKQLRLDYVQLHGRVSRKSILSIQKRGIKIIQAFGISSSSDLIDIYESKADLILLDTKVSNLYGGSGKTFDWSIKLPEALPNMVLAGGINAENIVKGVRRFQPLVVDVNSGVEISPGIKSKKKLKDFFGACNKINLAKKLEILPDKRGRFGSYGGRYVPETVMHALDELTREYSKAKSDKKFKDELKRHLKLFVGRPSPLYPAERLSEYLGGPRVWFKREDLNHTGAHKINNTVGQILLALRMGKKRIIAETGAGQHGLATATVCARFGLPCVIYMGQEDIRRQAPNVEKIKLLGAKIVSVTSGSRTLKDATNEALRDWVTNIRTTFYIIGSVVGPHPYPMIVRDFQSVIGRETMKQCKDEWGGLPDAVIACVGGGSNAMGIFSSFITKHNVRLIGVEAAGHGVLTKKHAATLSKGRPGVLHGSYSYLIYDQDGQIILPHSISAGLDYPGIGPEHSYYKDTGRIVYGHATDREALKAFRLVSRLEGIIPALETSHALAYLIKKRKSFKKNERVVICLSGRGDKDMSILSDEKGNK